LKKWSRRVIAVAFPAACLLLGTNGRAAFGSVKGLWMEAEVLHDLAVEYRSAKIADSAATSVGDVNSDPKMDYALLKRYLFLHPPSGEATAATATYSLTLPSVTGQEKLLLVFAVGLRPGWREAGGTTADGVIFQVLVNGEKLFDHLRDRDGWCYAAVDLRKHSGKSIQLTLACDRNKNSSADWAIWGDPRVVLLRPVSGSFGAHAQANLLILETSATEEISAEWPALGPAGSGTIRPTADSGQSMIGWYLMPPSSEGPPRLPQMKLPNGSVPAMKSVAIASFKPKIELVSVGQSSGVVKSREAFSVVATLRNNGEGPLIPEHAVEVRLGLPRPFRLGSREQKAKILPEIPAGGEHRESWQLLAPAETGTFRFALKVGLADLSTFDVVISPEAKGINYSFLGPGASGFHEKEAFVVLEKGDNRIAFVRDGERFAYGTVLVKAEGRWLPLGRCVPFGELSVRLRNGESQRILIQPAKHVRLERIGERTLDKEELAVRFSEEVTDDDSVRWRFDQVYVVKGSSPWIDVETSLSAEAPREVLWLMAPKVLAGDGGFGPEKDQALFPGLEYLGENEPSSSTRDIAFPQSRRFTPHPLRVTIPLMAVRKGESVLGLSWDVHQKWYKEEEMPTPVFSSPNRLPFQYNHLMSLLVPSVPEFIDEGTLDSKRALSLAADEVLQTKASILVLPKVEDITDAAVAWIQRHGLPQPTSPRSFEEELELCRFGYLRSVWNDSAQGWSHCVGWAAHPYPGYCTLLNMDYFFSRKEDVRRELRERIDFVVRKCIDTFGAGSLWRGDACHILAGELPFLEGTMAACLGSWERSIDGLLRSQSSDGSWRWRPDEKHASLGKAGDTTSGMCARGACQILREAIVTGNRRHIEAGLKALESLDRYTIPTGAQEWECPLYAPDVLASAYAVRAFVLAYEITGEDRYLGKAKYWAKTGIPFTYLWDRGKDMPQMLYAGIPIFGATYYTHSWLGRPVQWCALVYAYSLQRLARHDSSFDWRGLAEGITTSAMWQQYTDGKSKGTYPDSWELLQNHANPADINPENILVNLLALKGYDPGLKHKVFQAGDDSLFVTTIAEMVSATIDVRRAIKLRLRFLSGAKSYVVVSGLSSRATPRVVLNGAPLPPAEDVDGVSAGWLHDTGNRRLIIALTHGQGEDSLEIF
jgi:hypothetical protein